MLTAVKVVVLLFTVVGADGEIGSGARLFQDSTCESPAVVGMLERTHAAQQKLLVNGVMLSYNIECIEREHQFEVESVE